MAYGTIYKAYGTDFNGTSCNIEIQKKDYTGTSSSISVTGCELSYNLDEHIYSTSVSLTFDNDADDWNEYDDLLSNYEKQYKIQITFNSTVIYQGFLVCDFNEQTFGEYSSISLSFTNYIKRLSDLEFSTSIEIRTLSSIIHEILGYTESDSTSFYLNSALYHEGLTLGNQLLETKVSTDIFQDNESEAKSCYEVLEMILKSFNMFIYQYNNSWYIERYDQINDESAYLYYYDSSNSYTARFANGRESLAKETDYDYLGQTQTLGYNSGANDIQLTLNDNEATNLIDPTYSNWTGDASTYAHPDLKGWIYNTTDPLFYYETDEEVTLNHIILDSWRDIAYPVKRYIYHTDNDDDWSSLVSTSYNSPLTYNGLVTRYSVTVGDDTDDPTELEIGCTLGVYASSSRSWSPQNSNCTDWRLYYFLEDGSGNYYYYDDALETWEIGTGIPTNYIEFTSSDFDNSTDCAEISQSIDLTNTSTGSTGVDLELKMCIAQVAYKYNGTWYWLEEHYIGDFTASANGETIDNLIDVTINEDFISTTELELDLFDVTSLNYSNGLMYGTDNTRTDSWTDDGGSTYYNLYEHLIMSYYNQLYKITKSMSATIALKNGAETSLIKPFTIFTDDYLNDNETTSTALPMYLQSYTYDIITGQYAVALKEYTDEEFTVSWT